MATCGSLRTFFENPLPENPTLLESLSNWNKIHPRNPVGLSNLTEIFGELHFKEKLESPMRSPDPPSTWLSLIDPAPEPAKGEKPIPNLQKCSSLDSLLGTCKSEYMGCPMHKDCFLCRNSDSLPPPFTEGLGFESSDEVEDAKNEEKETGKGKTATDRDLRSFSGGGSFKMSKTGGSFPPPPLTCMGKMGKPWVQFKSFKEDGRFVLREIKIPTLEVMRASRQDGRLKLHLVQQEEDESAEEEEEEAEEKEGDDEHVSSAMGVQTA